MDTAHLSGPPCVHCNVCAAALPALLQLWHGTAAPAPRRPPAPTPCCCKSAGQTTSATCAPLPPGGWRALRIAARGELAAASCPLLCKLCLPVADHLFACQSASCPFLTSHPGCSPPHMVAAAPSPGWRASPPPPPTAPSWPTAGSSCLWSRAGPPSSSTTTRSRQVRLDCGWAAGAPAHSQGLSH